MAKLPWLSLSQTRTSWKQNNSVEVVSTSQTDEALNTDQIDLYDVSENDVIMGNIDDSLTKSIITDITDTDIEIARNRGSFIMNSSSASGFEFPRPQPEPIETLLNNLYNRQDLQGIRRSLEYALPVRANQQILQTDPELVETLLALSRNQIERLAELSQEDKASDALLNSGLMPRANAKTPKRAKSNQNFFDYLNLTGLPKRDTGDLDIMRLIDFKGLRDHRSFYEDYLTEAQDANLTVQDLLSPENLEFVDSFAQFFDSSKPFNERAVEQQYDRLKERGIDVDGYERAQDSNHVNRLLLNKIIPSLNQMGQFSGLDEPEELLEKELLGINLRDATPSQIQRATKNVYDLMKDAMVVGAEDYDQTMKQF